MTFVPNFLCSRKMIVTRRRKHWVVASTACGASGGCALLIVVEVDSQHLFCRLTLNIKHKFFYDFVIDGSVVLYIGSESLLDVDFEQTGSSC